LLPEDSAFDSPASLGFLGEAQSVSSGSSKDDSGAPLDQSLDQLKLSQSSSEEPKVRRKLLVEHQGKKIKIEGSFASTQHLLEAIRHDLSLDEDTQVDLEYYDQDFEEYVSLRKIEELGEKAKLKVVIKT